MVISIQTYSLWSVKCVEKNKMIQGPVKNGVQPSLKMLKIHVGKNHYLPISSDPSRFAPNQSFRLKTFRPWSFPPSRFIPLDVSPLDCAEVYIG